MNGLLIYLGCVVVKTIHFLLMLAPVVLVEPVGDKFLHVVLVNAVVPASIGWCLVPLVGLNASSESD